ncbi:hypothetical protein [Bradyrhizobium elkanii]|uniref:Uncharacterized protein n=1 Tax=Bradyrhizobium elkanii TaxID=29448 RepID=A0ABV4EUD7_BRAEL|nr:hypothetical protein [Bradyrhizobium elkanii]MCP1755666.1 hypothetical protein [Bradyrhizobium elkanii]MCP1981182.1 hypothetical protein [Bradyrhizobium elkanii]MCS3884040.1 hypothetical protein [Bradyrhizobium elkanii]MCS4216932.1 hypothetical protein [Bradyrhizobium elkanii]MCW2196627.1 hypothetical protein [Bradyrhizobium elkanii]
MTAAKPLARYGAVWGARAGGFARPSYTISRDMTRLCALFLVESVPARLSYIGMPWQFLALKLP